MKQAISKPFNPGPRLGNPNLGRETEKQKKVRTRAFTRHNLLMKEERLHVDDCSLADAGIMHALEDETSGRTGAVYADGFMDNLFKKSYWR